MDTLLNLFSDNFVSALGWTVLSSLWQALLIGVLLYCALIIFKHKSSKFKYRLSMAALITVFLSAIGTFAYCYNTTSCATACCTTSTSATPVAMNTQDVNVAVLITNDYWTETSFQIEQYIPSIALIWIAGFIFLALRLMVQIGNLSKLRKSAVPMGSEKWDQLLKNVGSKFPIKKSITIAESALTSVPLVIGYLKPIVLFPVGTVNQLTTEQVEAILAHELSHVFRNDYVLNFLQNVIETIFYYHPIVWWISEQVRVERENSCDDLAIKITGNNIEYAKALLQLQESKSSISSLAMAIKSNEKLLLQRVRRILNQPPNKTLVMEKIMSTTLLLALIFAFTLGTSSPLNSINEPTIEECEIIPAETLSCADGSQLTNLTDETKLSSNRKDAKERRELVTAANTIVSEEATQQSTLMKLLDTIPDDDGLEKGELKWKTATNVIELTVEDGEIRKLIVDGKEIPKEQYDEYTDQINKTKSDIKIQNIDVDNKTSNSTSIRRYYNEDNDDSVLKIEIDEDTGTPKWFSENELFDDEMNEFMKELQNNNLNEEELIAMLKESQSKFPDQFNMHFLEEGDLSKFLQNHLAEAFDWEDFEKASAFEGGAIGWALAQSSDEELWEEALEDHLWNDRLIKNKNQYQVKMTSTYIKIDGRKYEGEVLQKYLNLYKTSTGDNFGEGSKFVKSKSAKSTRTTHSTSQ